MTAKELNDLFHQARDGNNNAEKQLFEYLSVRFRRFVYHKVWDPMDVDEIVQETMMTICREYKELEISSSISAWAYKVLDNRILSFTQARQLKNRRTAGDSSIVDFTPMITSNLDLKRRLIDCLRKICLTNRRYARVLNLHSQGYETDDICDRLKMKENTLYSLLHRSRAVLQRCLETGDIH